MVTTNHTTTFWHFLENYSIEIPIIQRDYAQGRVGKESLRKSFLNDLKEVLDKPVKELKLDFVYGSNENKKLFPLDGQQRLTTLWLLHWFIALKSHRLKEASKLLNKFSYETRVSSRNFCEEMCKQENFEKYNCGNDIVGFITNQTWFYSAWKQDPTIQSMLRMLGGSKDKNDLSDGIEKVFGCCNCISNGKSRFDYYYDLLTGVDCPIVFYYLPKDFGNSDDLYIKMNARGEQLTSFENFKADLIGYIEKQAKNDGFATDQKEIWEELLNPKYGIPKKIDTDWTDIFWKNKSKGTSDGRMANRIDEIYFAFLNRFFWNSLFMLKINKDNKSEYVLKLGEGLLPDGGKTYTIENENDSYKYLNGDKYYTYFNLDPYKYDGGTIPLVFFNELLLVLDRLGKYNGVISECNWDNAFRFIPEYVFEKKEKRRFNALIENENKEKVLAITGINQIQRIVFYAVCKYLKEGEADEISMKRWMRVVWNLVSGYRSDGSLQIRSTTAMRTAMEFIDSLDSHNVYKSLVCKLDNAHLFQSLNNPKGLDNTDFGKRCKEEIAKAYQIIINNPRDDGKTWEQVIEEAETAFFFKGSIRFLFTADDGSVDWSDFDEKLRNARWYFDRESNTIELAKYFDDEDVKRLWKQFDFTTDSNQWEALLLLEEPIQIHNFLMKKEIVEKSDLVMDIEYLVSKIEGNLWLRDWHTDNMYLTNYRTQISEPENGYVYMVGNRKRNRLISGISQSAQINIIYQKGWGGQCLTDKEAGNQYHRGIVFDLKYGGHYFRLHKNNTICLMNKDRTSKQYKNAAAGDKPENTYYFPVKSENVDDIINQLNCLISRFESDKKNSPCYDNCQNKVK